MKRARGRPRHADLLAPSEWRTVREIALNGAGPAFRHQ